MAAADAPAADAPTATLEAATGAWTGAAADAPAADAPTMGISFFSIAGGFLRGFFFGCGEDDGTGEAVAVRTCVEGEEKGSIKTKVACTATRVRYARLQRAPRHESNPGTFGVLSYNLGPYTEILSVLSFPLEYLDWQVQYTQFYPQVASQQRVNK